MNSRTTKIAALVVTSTLVVSTLGVVLGASLEKGYGVSTKLMSFVSRYWPGLRSPTAELSESRQSPIPEPQQGNLQLFILAGQSNMSGMGAIPESGKAPESGKESHPNVYVFGNDYRWKPGREPVDDPSNQVDPVSIDLTAGVGPALSFASTVLAKQPNAAIGLIPCAKGGSLISEWRRSLSDTTLYGSCLKRIRAASAMGKIAGILYFQGEIDAVDPKEHPDRTFLPNQWASEFTTLVKDWRQDLGHPQLPIVFAQIGTHADPTRFKHWDQVKAQQRSVRLPFSAMITTDDLALQDYAHFTTDSYRVIGQRFGQAYLSLPPQPDQKSSGEQKASN